MYRVVNPYGFEVCPWVYENEVTVDPCYLKIDATDPENVLVAPQSIGINWGDGEMFVVPGYMYIPGAPLGVKDGNLIDLGVLLVQMGTSVYNTAAAPATTLQLPE